MFKLKSITVKNFMSVGNQTQAVDFDKESLTLVLGSNLDLGGDDTGSRNGTGKTTMINALSYALYGQAQVFINADARARDRRQMHHRQRRCKNVCNDGLARWLDDRAKRCDEGCNQLSVAHHVQRFQRCADGRTRSSEWRLVGS